MRKWEGKVNHVITSIDLEAKWHSCSNLSTSYGSRLRHIHRAQIWVVSCVLYSRAITALEFLLMSPGFNSFFWSEMSKTLSVEGGVLVVIKCIYLTPSYLHFMQVIEHRCILLTSSTSFVDLPFQEQRMMEKHHMDQNPYISILCPKPGVISDNMTQGDDVTKSLGPTDPTWGRPIGQGLAPMKLRFQHVSC
jgi:hypothetical protein